jgi:putative RecB family exonuclease
MPYHVSATKLQTYHRCPYAYYLRYEHKLTTPEFFGSAALGTALHQALAECHRDWDYRDSLPNVQWVQTCWRKYSRKLSDRQIAEGSEILERYYQRFIASQDALAQPLAVEGKIHARLQVENLEFTIVGRYDRIDFIPQGLELIDYKSSREVKLPDVSEMDIQVGLYYLALQQTYQKSLKYLSLLFLRTGEKIRFEATPDHREQVQCMIGDLAVRLRHDRAWEPRPSKQCDRCAYARYCPAISTNPCAVPKATAQNQLQLALNLG